MRRLHPGLWVSLLLLVASGCAAPQSVTHRDAQPADFSIDLTVLVGSRAVDRDRVDLPPHLRPSRFVVFPDGRLHHGEDVSRGADWLPPPVRTLNWPAMQELWSLATHLGFNDPEAAEEPVNFKNLAAQPEEVVYLLAMTGHEKRWAVVRSGSRQVTDPAMEEFIAHMAELAWVPQQAEASRPLTPRYDFGPDPYQQFR